MIREAINNFPSQFEYEPEIKNQENFTPLHKFLIVGMGGSALAPDLLKIWKPELDIILHRDYGLPRLAEKDLSERLIILSSYSGNTEEILRAFEEAMERKLPTVSVSIGGKLLELAKNYGASYIQMPDTGIQPRMGLGLSVKSLLKAMGEEGGLAEVGDLGRSLKAEDFEERGGIMARMLRDYIPVVYSSRRNCGIAYNWKIKFNETAKIPAFFNVIPELNHNEMTGFDVKSGTKELSSRFYFLILKDEADDSRIIRRMDVMEELYGARGLRVETISLKGDTVFQKIFSSLLLADWVSYYTAQAYGVEAEQVPMGEEFKELISKV